jgi:hypothetical protein
VNKKLPWWEDPARSRDGTCTVCNECRIHLKHGICMYGGPFIGYVKVDKDERRVRDNGSDGRNERTSEEAAG